MKVLVVHAPGLHAGYLGCYGNEWVETPHLDRLAAEGIVFDQHYADCPGAPESLRTSWTGRYCFPLPGEDDTPPAGDRLSLADTLTAGGIAFIHAGGAKASVKGAIRTGLAALDRLTDRDRWLLWLDVPLLVPPWQVPDEFLERYFAEGPEEEAEPLTPWTDPPAGPLDPADNTGLERLQNTYAAVVTHLDAEIGRQLEAAADDVLVCVTADRGLALGEHGVVGECRSWLHEEVIHLPLIVRLPGRAEACRRVFALTQPADLFPTLLETFGVPVPEAAQGRSLWPLLSGKTEQVRAYACAGRRVADAVEWALRAPEWGFILPVSSAAEDRSNTPQLYVKPDDRWEVNNVVQHHLDLAEHLEQTLHGFVQASRRPGPLHAPELRDLATAAAAEESSNPGGVP
jgi:arylsulfatase A-like enzyme